MQQKNGRSNEAKEDGEVIGYEVFRRCHGRRQIKKTRQNLGRMDESYKCEQWEAKDSS